MNKFYDAVIIGGGPAGLSAAIYMARAKYSVLVIEKEKIGGQITITSEVVNYPGVPLTDGNKLTEGMRLQADSFGAEFLLAEATDIDISGDKKLIRTGRGDFETLGVILATGASPRMIGFAGEREFRGRGVAYCATCDGEFFTDLPVFVVGGGFAAAEEAVFLTKYASEVTILVREEDFTCAAAVADEARKHPKITVKMNTEVKEVGGSSSLQYIETINNKTGETERFEAEAGKTFGVFVFAGYAPATGLFKNKVELNDAGYLITDSNRKTNVDGVYGAGDVCIKELRQVVTAVADGAIAATSLEKHAAMMYEKLGLTQTNKPVRKEIQQQAEPEGGQDDQFITEQMKVQLQPVFDKFSSDLILKVYVDASLISKEVEGFIEEVSALTPKITYEIIRKEDESRDDIAYPSIALCDHNGVYQGMQFHGVPGGHEFNSFIIALYNAAGPGQQIADGELAQIKAIDKKTNIKVIVSLSCTMCPDLVMAAGKIALENENIETEMYDMAHFKEIKDKYQIMSVPCMIINDEKVHFGKKNIGEILDILKT